MIFLQLRLPQALCIICSLSSTILALPSRHTRTLLPTTLDERATVPAPDARSSSTLSAADNGTKIPNFVPECFPDLPGPGPATPPITNLLDCGEAIRQLIAESHAVEPVVWFAHREWTYASCGVFLIPMYGIRTPRDTFSRLEIARDASVIQMQCANAAHGFRGGFVPIGVGVFDVALFGRPLEPWSVENWQRDMANGTALEERTLPVIIVTQPAPLPHKLAGRALPPVMIPQTPPPPSLTGTINASTLNASNIDSSNLYHTPSCWALSPPPGGHGPVTQPSDCGSAILQLIREGPSVTPFIWEAQRKTWTSGSCMIVLQPDFSYSLDRFSRLDIARAASQVQIACVNAANGFRGGALELGRLRLFDVWVEAPDDFDDVAVLKSSKRNRASGLQGNDET